MQQLRQLGDVGGDAPRGSVYLTFVAIKHRHETAWHSWTLAVFGLIAQLARHAGATASAGVRVIAPWPIGVILTNPSGIAAVRTGHGVSPPTDAGRPCPHFRRIYRDFTLQLGNVGGDAELRH